MSIVFLEILINITLIESTNQDWTQNHKLIECIYPVGICLM